MAVHIDPPQKMAQIFQKGCGIFFIFTRNFKTLPPTATPLPITPKKYVGDAVILMVLLIISYKNISKTIVLYYNEFLYYHEIKYQ